MMSELSEYLRDDERGIASIYGFVSVQQTKIIEAADALDAKDAEIERLKALTEWRPIATAPKDGTWIIVTEETGTYMEFVRWYEGSWCAFPQTIFGEGSGELPASDWCPNLEPPYQGLLDDDPEEGE